MSEPLVLARCPDAVARFTPHKPVVSAERILKIQGYADVGRVRPVIRRTAESMAAIAASLSEPAIGWRRIAIVSLEAARVELEGGAWMHCAAFGSHLRGCDAIAAFALGLGPALPQRVVDLAEAGDLLEGLLLETAGWLAIEDATRQFKVHLRESMLARGCRITSRMGPGYSYRIGGRMHTWNLEEQRELFALLGDEALPVRLMASCAMTPKMSRSGLYGIAPVHEPQGEPRT